MVLEIVLKMGDSGSVSPSGSLFFLAVYLPSVAISRLSQRGWKITQR